jgi:heme-degrading monooxygenase HmoA
MFVLHVEIQVKPGSENALEETFRGTFYPAISQQEGFVDAQLLRAKETQGNYRLCLSFDQEPSQQRWVATDLHEQVWSKMQGHFTDFAVVRYLSV